MKNWAKKSWGEVVTLRYGRSLVGGSGNRGRVQVFGTNGPTGFAEVEAQGEGPAVIVGRKGAYRGVHLAKGPFFAIDTAFYVDPAEGLDVEWVYYALLREDIQSLGSGSAIPSTRREDVYALQLDLPPIGEQIAIREVLGVLDEKIEANSDLISSAEALRRAVWQQGAPGASLVPLSSLAQFVNGGAFTKGATGTGRVVIRIAELNSGIGASTVYNDLEVPDRQIAHTGDLLMSWSGSLTAVRWFRDDAIVNQHIFKVIPREDHPLWAVACAVENKLDEFREIAAGKATTMGHIKRADLDSPVEWPEISDRLNDTGTALWLRALAAERENLRLAETRDELLPLLMSGKITVKDAEKTVEEVV